MDICWETGAVNRQFPSGIFQLLTIFSDLFIPLKCRLSDPIIGRSKVGKKCVCNNPIVTDSLPDV